MYVSRIAAALFAIAVVSPALAGDVDTHFDRARGQEASAWSVRHGPPNEPRMVAVPDAAEAAPKKAEATTVAATSKVECTCADGKRVR